MRGLLALYPILVLVIGLVAASVWHVAMLQVLGYVPGRPMPETGAVVVLLGVVLGGFLAPIWAAGGLGEGYRFGGMASLSDNKWADLAKSFGISESAVGHYAMMVDAESKLGPTRVEPELRQRYDWTPDKADDF